MRRFGFALVFLLLAACGSTDAPRSMENPDPGNQLLLGERRDGRTRAAAHTELASAYYERGNLGVALEEAKIATDADSTYAPAQNLLGLIFMELKEPAEARASFEQALRIDPRDSDANHNMGHFLCDTGHELESIKFFLAAIQNPLYRTPAKSYAAAAGCYEKAGRTEEAYDYFGRALKLDAGFVPAMLPYGRLLMTHGRLDEARTVVTSYNSRVPPSAESLALLLRIEQRRGDAAAAQSVATSLRERFPDSKEYRAYKRGDAD
jgi:type IV pilus assembly protein PilF